MPALLLTPAQRKEHRAKAHALNPVVMIGAEGLSEAVAKEVDRALEAHGLIKVRVFADDRAAREAMLESLAERLGAAPIQHIGKLLVLWRPPSPRERTEREDRKPGPKIVKVVSFSKSGNHRAVVKKLKVMGNERLTPGGLVKRAKVRAKSAKKASS